MSHEAVAKLRRTQRSLKGQVTKTTKTLTSLMDKPLSEVDIEGIEAAEQVYERALQAYCDCTYSIIDLLSGDAARDEESQLETFEADRLDSTAEIRPIKQAMKGYLLLQEAKTGLDLIEADPDNIASGYHDLRIEDLRMKVGAALKYPKLRNLMADGEYMTELGKLSGRMIAVDTIRAKTKGKPVTVTSEPHKETTKIPKISVPKFDGDILTWPSFWQRFNAMIGQRPALPPEDKLAYLRDAVEGVPEAKEIAMTECGEAADYDDVVKRLKAYFDRRREVYQRHVKALSNLNFEEWSKEDTARVERQFQYHIAYLKQAKLFDIEHYLTAMIVNTFKGRHQQKWEETTLALKEPPVTKDLLNFFKVLQAVTPSRGTQSEHKKNPSPPSNHSSKLPPPKEKHKPKASIHLSQERRCCDVCKESNHLTYQCSKYLSMPVEQRRETIRKMRACENCLAIGHFAKDCRSKRRCHDCGKAHHTSLHVEEQAANIAVECEPTSKRAGILQTCQVIAHGPKGETMQVRAILDSGAVTTAISARLAKCLNLKRRKTQVNFTGFQAVKAPTAGSKATLKFTDIHHHNRSLVVEAVVVDVVTNYTPQLNPVDWKEWKHLERLEMADPDMFEPGPIDVLFGSEVTEPVYTGNMVKGGPNKPVAWGTIFGWTLAGTTAQPAELLPVNLIVADEPTTDKLIERFWEAEQPPTLDAPVLTPDEEKAVQHFQSTCTRDGTNKYNVSLPWRDNELQLANSRGMAVGRFKQSEKKARAKGIWEQFSKGVHEYFDLGHAEKVPLSDLSKPDNQSFYMAMHPVLKARSTTTKCRIVWDASGKSTNGVSLNHLLLPGPSLLPPITDLIIKFRDPLVAFTADVGKMFRCIGLNHDSKDFHRFVWRDSPGQPFTDYRMTRVAFGVTSSPYLASAVLQQIALDNKSLYPMASEQVLQRFYMDDFLSGTVTVEQAVQLYKDITNLLNLGNMQLRKWRSNSEQFLKAIPEELKESEITQELALPIDHHRTLGISWDTKKDSLYVVTPSETQESVFTKRKLASVIARVYDVMGWLSPATITGKLLLQELWKDGAAWDQDAPDKIVEAWQQWTKDLPKLSKIPITRCYYHPGVIQTRQLHCFADASEKAFAGVLYLRIMYEDLSVEVVIVMAKTKVAPVRGDTIPRLELAGALLVARLATVVQKALNINPKEVFYWSDSTIVLHWITGGPHHLKTFAGNRIKEILQLSDSQAWRYVPTESNPADCATRGVPPAELESYNLWWEGPIWLKKSPTEWPVQKLPAVSHLPELKIHLAITEPKEPVEPLIITRYSSLDKCIRVLARIRRWTPKARQTSKSLLISEQEYEDARRWLLHQSQQRHFSEEISRLIQNRPPQNRSLLKRFNPFLDNQGTLRVGGRLARSDLAYGQKHPAIISGKDPFTRLLIWEVHKDLLHGEPKAIAARLAISHQLVGGKRAIREVWHNCVICLKQRARTASQMMGQLPPARTAIAPPFTNTGLDYAGPITLKVGRQRKPTYLKAYLAVFVCMATTAIHLELVEDLSTESFLACLDRFVSRRNIPANIWSDHGTNFVGAKRELKVLADFFSKQDTAHLISHYANKRGIHWHMTPERSPHFGGLWEAAVRQVKAILTKVIGQQIFTFNQYYTLLCRVEASLNSRPLIPASPADSDGVEPLTPAHFLTGRAMSTVPDKYDGSKPPALAKNWTLIQALHRSFWKRFQTEYLQTLNSFNKWGSKHQNITEGDLVAIKNEGLDKTFTLGRVASVHPGQDGMVRVATVVTTSGTYKRPIVKLVRLLPAAKDPKGCLGGRDVCDSD